VNEGQRSSGSVSEWRREYVRPLEFDRHLKLDECVAGKAADADRGAHMTAGFTEDGEEEIGCAVDNFWRVGKTGDGVDVAVDGEDAADLGE